MEKGKVLVEEGTKIHIIGLKGGEIIIKGEFGGRIVDFSKGKIVLEGKSATPIMIKINSGEIFINGDLNDISSIRVGEKNPGESIPKIYINHKDLNTNKEFILESIEKYSSHFGGDIEIYYGSKEEKVYPK